LGNRSAAAGRRRTEGDSQVFWLANHSVDERQSVLFSSTAKIQRAFMCKGAKRPQEDYQRTPSSSESFSS
jgi:hypothetical protein